MAKRHAHNLRLNEEDERLFRDGAAQHNLSLSEYNRQLIRTAAATLQVSSASGQEEVANLIAQACDLTNPDPRGLLLRAVGANVKRAAITGRPPIPFKELAGAMKLILELRGDGQLSPAPQSYESRLRPALWEDETGDEREGTQLLASSDLTNPPVVVSEQVDAAASPAARTIPQEPPAPSLSPTSRQDGDERKDGGEEVSLVISPDSAPPRETPQDAPVGSSSVPDDYPWGGRSAGDFPREGWQRRNSWMDW